MSKSDQHMIMGPLSITMTTSPDTFTKKEFLICIQHMTMGPFPITMTTAPDTLYE